MDNGIITPATVENLDLQNIPAEFIRGVTRFKIVPNYFRDGSGNYDGLAVVAYAKLHNDHSRTIFYSKDLADIIAFYSLMAKTGKITLPDADFKPL